MARGRPLQPIDLSQHVKTQLQSMARLRSLPHGIVRRAKIILMASEGINNKTIAQKINLSAAVVGMWRKRFIQHGPMGLYDEQKPGGPRSIIDEQVARLIRKTLNKKPPGSTHWACRSVTEETQLSKSTVHRVWKAFGIQSHRQKHFKLSADPFFVEKVRDSVGLYTNPPDKAMVLCVDEKSQIQALDQSQPMLPFVLGYVEGVRYDYKRHGTTTLFAAFVIASG